MRIDVHHHIHLVAGDLIMAKLDALEAAVRANTAADESAIALLLGLKQQLDEAGTDEAKLAELRAELEASTRRLADAVLANTPAAPQPEGGVA